MTKSREMPQAGHVARIGEMRNAHNLVGKPNDKRPFQRPRDRWKYNIKMGKIKLFCNWTFSIVLFFLKKPTTFRRLDSVSVFR
jgi:hypothetical protein